jgi:two-component system, LytTR family, response regulator
MNPIRTIIIDDELPARELIKVYLRDHPQIELIGEAKNGFEGAKLINELLPDLVFLDIQMPKIDGFELLELIDKQPAIIFCTAYDQYAIKAFDNKALDYLLKPFSKERFKEAIDKISVTNPSAAETSLPSVIDYRNPLSRVVVKDRKEIVIIDVEKIHYLVAQDDYVEIHTAESKWLKQQTMKYFEQALDQTKFVRVHRKYILRLSEIAKLDKLGKETHIAILKSGVNIPVSNSGYKILKEQLGI